MSKVRMVNTRFWSDNFIREHLNPLDRYLFLYFLTNEKTNICGVYELPLSIISSETGIEKEMLLKMMKRLKGKIDFQDGWVIVWNFARYQNLNSEKVKIGMDRVMSEIPSRIKDYMDKNTPSPYHIHTISISSGELKPELKLESELQRDSVESANVVEIVESFKQINPSYKKWFANKTQRAAVKRLLEVHGLPRLKEIVAFLPKSNTIPYVPTITSPLALEEKFADLEAGMKKLKNKAISSQPKVII